MDKFIKNKGITETIIRKDNQDQHTKIKWNANYDGKVANLKMTSNTDGEVEKFDVKLDNDDLAELLNVRSVNMSLDKRLKQDFLGNKPRCMMENEPMIYQIEYDLPKPQPIPYLPTPDLSSITKELSSMVSPQKLDSIGESLKSHISSPLSNEEILVPLALEQAAYTLTPKHRHIKRKTHVTHRAYKKNISKRSDRSKRSSKRSDRRSSKYSSKRSVKHSNKSKRSSHLRSL